MLRRLLPFLLALQVGAAALFARGGGGCLERGTLIDTPRGPIPVEQLSIGDNVWGLVAGERVPVIVQAVFEVMPANYIELVAGNTTLRLTPEHPVQVAPGTFVRADRLEVGRVIPNALRLATVRFVPATAPAYNLLVSPGGVYFAHGFTVHNKGCFLPETPVTMADGTRRAISAVGVGDAVLAFDPHGAIVPAYVQRVLTHQVESHLILRTARVELHVTEEHPFLVGDGIFKTAEALRPGDTVFAYDGTGLTPQPVLAIERRRASVTVYNLQTDAPHTFLADGIAVHNKGGGGGGGRSHSRRSSSSSHGSSGEAPPAVVFFVIGAIIVLYLVAAKRQSAQNDSDDELDFCFSRSDIDGKARKTHELLTFIGKVDDRWSPTELETVARNVFTKLQSRWAAREYAEMEPLLMRDLYEDHCAQLRGLRHLHEVNVIEQLAVEAVDLVHVRYTDTKDQRSFTALITARARDYYINDQTREFLRGDTTPARFQEFWTFQMLDGAFRLREIEQSRESDALTTENFFEQFTDLGRDQIYGAAAGQTGPAGPALPPEVQVKAQKIDRLLNFLVQTDRSWNREEMIATVRRVFLNVLLGWQDGRPGAFAGTPLTPALMEQLRGVNAANQQNGWKAEYRNLCIRKVEIVHVNNRDDRPLDEFTVRLTAHAQVIITHSGRDVRRDEWVKPWTEFWTFGRDGQRWVLKEILPEARGEATIERENVDEGTSAQMLEWYYSKTRAT